jgi:putative ATPase
MSGISGLLPGRLVSVSRIGYNSVMSETERTDSAEGDSLFEAEETASRSPELTAGAPLAARMRPRTLEEFVGQEGVVGPGTLLRRAIETDHLPSVIFWGPPGCGKSTLAQIIAHSTKAAFEHYSAVTSGVADLRKVIERARERRRSGRKTILFVDEIHRWNRSQQDALLPHIENGTIALIGATTENPYFEVNAPLLSRARILRFERLSDEHVRQLILRALSDRERGLGAMRLEIAPDALEHLVMVAGGDIRNALNALETAALSARAAVPQEESATALLTLETVEQAVQQRVLAYDREGDEHYDTISAFIKSVRGSDPDAALYWLAKMLLAGEDIKFIARRLLILASEDIGNADPLALVVANAAAQTVMFVGLPEAQLTLSQATIYLATAPKSNACTVAIGRAMEEVQKRGAKPVPLHLRDSHYPGGKRLGHGKGYLYPHDFPGNYVKQEYAPPGAIPKPFYEPTENGHEARIKRRMEERRAADSPPEDPEN